MLSDPCDILSILLLYEQSACCLPGPCSSNHLDLMSCRLLFVASFNCMLRHFQGHQENRELESQALKFVHDILAGQTLHMVP